MGLANNTQPLWWVICYIFIASEGEYCRETVFKNKISQQQQKLLIFNLATL